MEGTHGDDATLMRETRFLHGKAAADSLLCGPRPCLLQGAVDTSFISKHEGQLLGAEPVAPSVLALAALAFLQIAMQRAQVGWRQGSL